MGEWWHEIADRERLAGEAWMAAYRGQTPIYSALRADRDRTPIYDQAVRDQPARQRALDEWASELTEGEGK